MNKRQVGTAYEEMTVHFLKAKGYEIVEKNFRCRLGEIDLIAREDGYLVFVEVKFRRDARTGYGLEAVDQKKQKRIFDTARYYLMKQGAGEDMPCRFDVVGITGEEIELIKNAF